MEMCWKSLFIEKMMLHFLAWIFFFLLFLILQKIIFIFVCESPCPNTFFVVGFVFELCINGIPVVFWKSLSFRTVLPVGKMYNLCGKWYFRNKVSSVTSNARPCFVSSQYLYFRTATHNSTKCK